MEDLHELNAPEGATSVNHGGKEYVVKKGKISVPFSAIDPLVGAMGYTVTGVVVVGKQEEPAPTNTSTPAEIKVAPSAPQESAETVAVPAWLAHEGKAK